MSIMYSRFEFFLILSIFEACRAYTPAVNPPMLTHASMDVGNIISIVIPESPDENINVEQLTGEFRQQLERIKKQSRASKVEHGLVTLKRVLPEMSREEKRKTLPLIRRVLHGRRVSNPANARNWTRDTRGEQMRDGGQYMRSRSTGSLEDRRMHRDYEEMGNREAANTRNDLTSPNREDHRRVRERPFANRRDELFLRRHDPVRQEDRAMRENLIRRSDNIRQEEFIRREDTDRREDHVLLSEDDTSAGKIYRPLQEWKNQNWDDQNRGEARVYPETSTVDWDYKLDRSVRQKDPANEILQGEKFDKAAKLAEISTGNVREEINADCTKLNSRVSPSYLPARPNGIDNSKPNVKDFGSFEPADVPTFVNYPREFDINGAINPNCDDNKRNHSGQSSKDSFINKVQPQGPTNFELEDYRGSQKIIQEPREQSERFNVSGYENISGENYNYAMKKSRGHNYLQDSRGIESIQPSIGDRWNAALYADRQPMNSSDEPRDLSNVYEMIGEKSVHPGLSYIQTEQGGFRSNLDNERKIQGPQSALNYGNDGLTLRIQRATNVTTRYNDIPKLNKVENILERLKRLFKAPESPVLSYNRVILVYGDESGSYDKGDRETFTEAQKSRFITSPSMAEPSSSTSHDLPRSDQSVIAASPIPTTQNFGPLKILPVVPTI